MTLREALVAALVVSACATLGADPVLAQAASPSSAPSNQPSNPASSPASTPASSPASTEVLHYSAEWRFVRAGDIEVYNLGGRQTVMKLFSSGLVSRLFHVEDNYTLTRDEQGCNKSLVFLLTEGRRKRDIRASFDKQRRKATFVERDLTRDVVTTQKESDIPGCVYDLTGALKQLRETYRKPGSSWTLPISDGKKTANVRVEAQEKELIRTPLGQFPSTRYEAFVFSGAFYGRKGRLFVWMTDDERHLPIQLRIQLPFYVGTITLQLEKVERK